MNETTEVESQSTLPSIEVMFAEAWDLATENDELDSMISIIALRMQDQRLRDNIWKNQSMSAHSVQWLVAFGY